jgi:cytoskeleton protein RodZ
VVRVPNPCRVFCDGACPERCRRDGISRNNAVTLLLVLLTVARPFLLSYDVPVVTRAKLALSGRENVGEFGDKFRTAREKKEISLDDASNVTKIGARMLRAIEEEHFDQLPGGVFNKGFIRAYAKHLGLDAEEAVTEYLACLRQAQIDAHEVWDPDPSTANAAHGAPQQKRVLVEPAKNTVNSNAPVQVEELPGLQLPRAEHVRSAQRDFGGSSTPDIPWRIIAVTAVVIVLAAILWIRHSHRARTAAAVATPVHQPIPAPVNPLPVNAPARSAQPTPISPSAPKSQPSQITHPAAAVSTPSSPVVTESPTVTESNDVTTRTFGKPVIPPPARAAAPLTLVIRAQETSWISVQADGQQISRETLIAPAHASIRAGREIVARIGNAAGVTFVFNGQEIPANGAESEVKTFVFDANGMRVVPTAPLPTPDH